MAFNINSIPPENRSKQQIAAHVEIWKRTQDTCLVHNPTKEAFIVWNDKLFSNEKWIVPSIENDIGFGKGNLHVPRFIADRYINKMGEKMIIKISEEDWAKRKLQYRQDEWGEKEERMAIRTNNREEWEKIVPKLFKGVVKRYQGEADYEEEPAAPKKQTFSTAQDILESLGIADQEVGVPDVEDKKQDLIDQLQ